MITIEVRNNDVSDLMRMVMDYTKNRGNTFHYILRELKERFPDIAERLSDE